ncbi:L-histidine N(alpha)-methyltransferase [Hymenobacter qilianensis]|uniref:L-histidine N(Alpha)-methyltransferase n=1 Tax=Hymenobacter qilianensis TaxID=1385715 RepID=A0A7H0H0P3_9BACT|nr:L-histidine N(alpha)-methyltransferase [Hymenobacter qilianensis]
MHGGTDVDGRPAGSQGGAVSGVEYWQLFPFRPPRVSARPHPASFPRRPPAHRLRSAKSPRLIRAAYDDAQGVTAAFNLNLLTRLNRELGGNFDLAYWHHYTDYDPIAGVVRSFLVSTCAQQVHLEALAQTIDFAAWEIIHTENSYKFTRPLISQLATEAGLEVQNFFTDEQAYFADVVLAPQA